MPHIIAFLFLTIVPLLPHLITAIVTRSAVALGFGTASYFGIDLLFETVLAKLSDSTSGLPADVVLMIGLIGIDDAFNIMLSAGFALFVFKGLSVAAGRATVRNSVWRKPGTADKITDWGA